MNNTKYPEISLHDSIVDNISMEQDKELSDTYWLCFHFRKDEGFILREHGQLYKYANAQLRFKLMYPDDISISIIRYIGLRITAIPIYYEISLKKLMHKLRTGKWKLSIIDEAYGSSAWLETFIDRCFFCKMCIWYTEMEYLGDKELQVHRSVDIQRTKDYYEQLSFDDLCQCDECINYRKEIKKTYPDVAEFLVTIGVDIEKPFEIFSCVTDRGYMECYGALYAVFGSSDGFLKTELSGVEIAVTDSYPDPCIQEEYFVIKLQTLQAIKEQTHDD